MTNTSEDLEFYINGCALMITTIFGLVGNLVCISLLQRRRERLNPTFSNLITWLAIIDSVFLIFVTLTFSLPSLSAQYKKWIFPVLLPFTLPLTSISLTASLYLVIATSVERYLQLYHERCSNKGSFFGYVLPVLVFSIFYNIPKFLEFTTTYPPGDTMPILKVTEFRSNVEYSYYVLGSNFIFMGVLPFSTLIVLNIRICRKFQNYFSSPEQYESRTMSGLLLTIVLVQILCHLPRSGLNFYEIYMALTIGEINLSSAWIVDVSHLLLSVASASNVAIFAVQDIRFRTMIISDIKRFVTKYRQNNLHNNNSQNTTEQTALNRDENLTVVISSEDRRATERKPATLATDKLLAE